MRRNDASDWTEGTRTEGRELRTEGGEPIHSALVVAVSEELRAILGRMRSRRRANVGEHEAWTGRMAGQPVAVLRSGMGTARALDATRAIIAVQRPRQLIAIGFCGGMSEWAGPSDVVVSEYVMDWPDFPGQSDLDQPRIVFAASPDLLEAARRLTELPNDEAHLSQEPDAIRLQPPAFGFRVTFGGVLSVDRLVRTTTVKGYHGPRAARCRAIDMESAGAARAADEAGVPWISVRGVTDTLEQDLPLEFEDYMTETGEVSRTRVLAAALRRPLLIPDLLRLGGESLKAARNLATFVEALVGAT